MKSTKSQPTKKSKKETKVVQIDSIDSRYTRKQRRKGAFAVQNNENGKFLSINEERVADTTLPLSSLFPLEEAKEIINILKEAEPKLNIDYILVEVFNGKRITIL